MRRFTGGRNEVGGFWFSSGEITSKEDVGEKKKSKSTMALSKGCQMNEAI